MQRRAEPLASSPPSPRVRDATRAVVAAVFAATLSTCAVGADPTRVRDSGGGGGDGTNPPGTDATADRVAPPMDAPRCTTSCTLPNASARCNAGVCELGACNRGFADADGNVGNGCECETGMAGDTCATAQNLGMIMPGAMQMARGAIGRAGGEQWFTVGFATGGRARVMLTGGAYRFDVRYSCMSTERFTCMDRMEGATGLTSWEFFDNPPMMGMPGDGGSGMGMSMPTRMVAFPNTIAIRVHSPTPPMGCQQYTIVVSN